MTRFFHFYAFDERFHLNYYDPDGSAAGFSETRADLIESCQGECSFEIRSFIWLIIDFRIVIRYTLVSRQ